MYGFGGLGLSEVQHSISELSVVGGWWTGQTHFMVGPSQGPTINILYEEISLGRIRCKEAPQVVPACCKVGCLNG